MRLPARSLADLELEEKSYKPDFELTVRFEEFATELERLSLLGIGSYGFLLTTVAFDKGQATSYLTALTRHPLLLAFGVLAFAVSAGCALFSNFLSTKCLACQLDIVRMLGRLSSDRWSPEEQEINKQFVRKRQVDQKRGLTWNRLLLFLATLSLIAGALAVASTFALVLFAAATHAPAPAHF
jgi:hypothetical protein